MKIKNMYVPKSFKFLLELYNLIIDKRKLPSHALKMLSSRNSGKTHNVLYTLYLLLLLQTKTKIVLEFVRARSGDCEKELNSLIQKIYEISPNAKIKSNSKLGFFYVNNNKFRFTILNEEKNKVDKNGGKIGLVNELDAEYFLVFYEEVSQLNKDLVENHRHGIRGNANTEYLFFYASNPWNKGLWFIEEFLRHLPEGKSEENELLDRGFNATYDAHTDTIYYRPRWTLNRHNLKNSLIDDMERLKEINYNKWRIVSLGFSGNLTHSLYLASLEKANTKLEKHIEHTFRGGVDWGDGKSAKGSPTTALILGISPDKGIDVYGELEWFNNKGIVLSTEEIMIKIAKFYIQFYKNLPIKKNMVIAVDNAALGDFFVLFQQVFNRLGYGDAFEVVPASKPKNTWERVEVVNFLLSTGTLRLNQDTSPRLWYYLENCYEVAKLNPTEDIKRERSHEFTHGIHALEYGIGEFLYDFREQIPYFDNKSLGKYAII